MSLGPGLVAPEEGFPVPLRAERHDLPQDARIVSKSVLSGLHHEYRLEQAA